MDNKEYKELNAPFKWVGGKSRLRKFILPIIPKHTCYVEPFCGAAWVLFGKPPSEVEVINDIDNELINFFKVVKERPYELIESFEWELVSRHEFNRLAIMPLEGLDEIQRAHRFYYIIMAGWGGELNYPRFQTSVKDGGHGNRLFGAIKHLKERIEPVYKRLQTVIIENLDWVECIDRYDKPSTVFYLDPPYPQNGANYLYNMRNWEDHYRLSDRLSQSRGKWILSSYDIPEVHELYRNYLIIPIQSYSGMVKEKNGSERVLNNEVLVTNFEIEDGIPTLGI